MALSGPARPAHHRRNTRTRSDEQLLESGARLRADPLSVHDVELGLLERGRQLFFDLHAGAVPDNLVLP